MKEKSRFGRAVRRFAPCATASAFFGLMAALYLADQRLLYFSIIRHWGIDPWPTPFLDAQGIVSALRCQRMGIDVIAANPCDPLARAFNYSPAWLALAALPGIGSSSAPAALGTVLCFLAALLLLPAGRSASAAAVVTVAAISPPVVFAIERANADLIMFALAALAATLACRSAPFRLVGYGVALLAGLLKYYPLTLLALAARERPRLFRGVALGATLLIALVVLAMGHDLARALRLIPSGSAMGSMFGASTVARAIAPGTWLQPVIELMMTVAVLLAATRLATRRWLIADLGRLNLPEATALLVGAVLILGCFFTAQNIAYRAIHLLFVLPALTALGGAEQARQRWRLAVAAVLLLLWSDAWRGGPDVGHVGDPMAALFGWLAREALWWCVVTLLLAVTIRLLLASEAGRWLGSKRDAPRCRDALTSNG